MAFLSLFGCSKSQPTDQPLKTISYRGGIVRFTVPSHWREEYEPEGGGTFYEDRPDSGTLRVNIITFEAKNGESTEEVIKRSFPLGSREMLPSGLHMRRRIVDAIDQGTPIRSHHWEIAVPLPSNRLRIVCFSHTILSKLESDSTTVKELALIERSIRAAEFSQEFGVIEAPSK